jgi:O-antigen/teichoic acid export membrane protein
MSQYLRNIGAMIGQSTIQRLLGMLTTIVLARVLGSANFGIYSIVANTAGSAYGFVRLGIDAAIHVHTSAHDSNAQTREAKGRLLGAGLILLMGAGMIASMGCLVCADWISDVLYGQPNLGKWIRLAAVLVFLQCLSQFCYASLAGLHRFNEYAKVMILVAVLNILSASAASWLWGLSGAIYASIFVQGIATYLLWHHTFIALRRDEIILKFQQLGGSFRTLIHTGFPFYVSGLLALPVYYYLQGVLGRDVGLDSLGHLRVIVSITAVITFLPTSIAAVMVSHLTRESGFDYSNFVQKTLANIKFIWIFVLLASAATFSVLPILIHLLFGDSYDGAITPASAALIASVLSCLLGVVNNVALSRKRMLITLQYMLIQAIVFLVFGIFLIARIGLTGYFFAEIASMGAALIFVWYFSRAWRRQNNTSQRWILPMVMLTLIMALAFSSPTWLGHSNHNWWIGLILLMLSVGVVYFFALDSWERNLFKSKVYLTNKLN